MAGLGCIGKNNLFLTPDFGPEVRLRALFTYLKRMGSTIAICAMRRWNLMWPKAKGLLLKEAKRHAGWSAIAEDANWCVRLARNQSINAERSEQCS
jgi:hypothetical protein